MKLLIQIGTLIVGLSMAFVVNAHKPYSTKNSMPHYVCISLNKGIVVSAPKRHHRYSRLNSQSMNIQQANNRRCYISHSKCSRKYGFYKNYQQAKIGLRNCRKLS
jgi:hypothetical protein